jgi:2-hydroxyacyl-CoA lyase 1
MAKIDGATLLARSLRSQGVESMFGIVGFPVFGVASAAQREGIRYYGFRNEQAASYAAGAVGFLTGRPGACLTVSGPGMVHGIAGLANAWANGWPMILLSGAPDSYQDGMGGFQECPQVEAARPWVKAGLRPDRIERLPFHVEQLVRTSISGRPGAVYLDLPNDILSGETDDEKVVLPPACTEPPRPRADPKEVERALALLREAKRPVVIVGKGAAQSRAEGEVRAFLERTRLPFLASPMGKGVVPDEHELSVAPARSTALREADLVFLIGARLNWILHFGLPPRFAADVKIIQMDVSPEEIGRNVPTSAALVGDARAITAQMNAALAAEPWGYPSETDWWQRLRAKVAENRAAVEAMERDDSVPMGYYRVLREVRERIPRDAIICSEGANTMDIGRSSLPNELPRHRLDAGTFGTMGVGLGFAIAAQVVHPDKKVVAVEGDSAFGFSGMEVEVMCRYGLPITIVVINNNGIGGGVAELKGDRIPPSVYLPNARYEKVMEAFGGRGWYVERPDDLGPALAAAIADPRPSLVNVMIHPRAQRKPQPFEWLTR